MHKNKQIYYQYNYDLLNYLFNFNISFKDYYFDYNIEDINSINKLCTWRSDTDILSTIKHSY